MRMLKSTRRRFLRLLAASPAGIWALTGGKKAVRAGSDGTAVSISPSPHPSEPRVIIAKRAAAGERNGLVPAADVARLLNDSMTAATGKADAPSAWRSLFGPADMVKIKVNCLAGRGLSSHPELVGAIVAGLASAGVPRDRIVIWDRSMRELIAAGFARTGINGARVLGTDSPQVGFERDIEFSGEVGSCFSRLLTRSCTAIINVPVLKDHDLSGVSLGMKNFYGAIHNPNKYHDNNCNPYIADLNAHPLIAKRLRLVICDGLKGQFHGGPGPRPQWSWPAATLLVGTDPVAVDRVGLEIIERKRLEAGMRGLKDEGRDPGHIRTASERGLGVSDLKSISMVNIS